MSFSSKNHGALGFLLSSAMLAVSAATVWAAPSEPLKIEFLPPVVEPANICIQRATDDDISKRWTSWDQKTLPSTKGWIILREAQRLRDMDATRNFQLVDSMIERLGERSDLSASDVMAERISLYLRASKIAELEQSGLLEKLFELGNGMSAREMKMAADLISSGIVKDQGGQEEVEKLLVRAASNGHADALLTLAKAQLDGKPTPGWDMEPSLAITMALGSMVGKLDDRICERIGRIAREFEKGEVVAADRHIAEAWLRVAADLGDGTAAWKVARYHMESTAIEKDNDILLRYLKMAADRGMIPAMVELAKIYNAGAIVEKDEALARQYFIKAADEGNRASLTHLASLYRADTDNLRSVQAYEETLRKLSELPQPPVWAFSRLGTLTLEKHGQWAGEAEATALFEQGAKLRDVSSMRSLADMRLRHVDEPGRFNEATNLLRSVLENFGVTGTVNDLKAAYLCRRPGGPDFQEAAKWQQMNDEDAAASWPLWRIVKLVRRPDAVEIAALQSEALYGRADALAAYLYYLKLTHADEPTLRQWTAKVAADGDAGIGHAKLLLAAASNESMKQDALRLYVSAAETGSVTTRVAAANAVITNLPENDTLRKLALDYLEKASAEGNGRAMRTLASLRDTNSVYAQYANVISTNGDATALMFAAEADRSVDAQSRLLSMASSIMDCNFENAFALAKAYGPVDSAKADSWMKVAGELTEQRGWRFRLLGDFASNGQGKDISEKALALYDDAVRFGDMKAEMVLLSHYSDPGKKSYSKDKAANVVLSSIKNATPDQLYDRVARIKKMNGPVRALVLSKLDLHDIYKSAAESGDPGGMREYAKFIVTEPRPGEDVKQAQMLLVTAANFNDVPAMLILARNHAYGIGGPVSLDEARLWLRKASDLGSDEAAEMLAGMNAKIN
ncbi:tetratricopeptide repeat protein [Agrobacterium rubi]|uniref:Sel1 repeat family protein n=1 Tax=Agrobacterium rubi TaxID=28099 RepID=A0AAE7RDP4_9HYPH|nr:SEL1-like repeat protein [Agrobacterium rubi]NTE88249.1 sel1 repeat family protein [Agrobacterium rubi]NTF04015.1 sel1 repeat family protein [Agrobacterium rubi]NTF38346.1 sel1 repeat family protein [Agrobacterium rubi]OCJ47037.1 hypothetical protein A6U92_12645 [Agrobacterium rubi]QTG02164.1 sel1 repeat family protein [Agrobacterium rubi]